MIPHVVTDWSGDATSVTFPYDQSFVDLLKDSIPPAYRSWHRDRKCWSVRRPYVSLLLVLLRQQFGRVDVTDQAANFRRPEPRPIRPTDHDYAALHLLPSAPAALVRAAYKCLARECHPDHGGEHEAMLALNTAFQSLQKRGAA